MEISEFVEKYVRLVRFVNELDDTLKYDITRESAKAFTEPEKYITNTVSLKMKHTIRVVTTRGARDAVAVEIPKDAIVEIKRPIFFFSKSSSPAVYVKDAGETFNIPFTPIFEYAEPLNRESEKVAEKIREIECKVCYVEKANPFIHDPRKLHKKIYGEYIQTRIRKELEKLELKLFNVVEEIVYPILSYRRKEYDKKLLWTYGGYPPGVYGVYAETMTDDILERFSEMHDTMVRGIIKIVESL